MASTISDGRNGGDDKIVQFPKTAEERRSLRKAKQDQEKQRLINIFIDEAGATKRYSTLLTVSRMPI